jgi:hypothetical protein
MTSSALNCRARLKGSWNVVDPVATNPIRSVARAIGEGDDRVEDVADRRVLDVAAHRGEVGREEEGEQAAFRCLRGADARVDVGVAPGVDAGSPPRAVQVAVAVGQGHPEDHVTCGHIGSVLRMRLGGEEPVSCSRRD